MAEKNDKEKDKDKEQAGKEDEVILLEDLQPRKDVKGGSAKVLFGETGSKGSEDGGEKS